MNTISKLLAAAAIAGLATGCVADAAAYHSGPTTAYPSQNAYNGYFRSDGAIHKRVHRALRRAPGVPADQIRVYVANGDVYLEGTVFSYRQKSRAHAVAHSVAGVQRVFTSDLRIAHRRHFW